MQELTELDRVRALCLALPEVTEKLSHGSPTWFVRKTFVTWVDDHHGDGRLGFWCAAPEGEQLALTQQDPTTYFVPPYVGVRGWVGVRLDQGPPDWELVAQHVEDAYRTVAPAKLVARLNP